LSALLSGLVVAYQLSNQHSFESRQKSEERQQKLIDEKARLTGEAAKLLGQMLGIRRLLVFDEFALDLANIRSEHSLERYTQQGAELAQRDFEGL
jgi:hypothetical protein